MDRQIVYPGSIPLDSDFLAIQRQAMIGLGVLARAVLGSDPIVDGLLCSPSDGLTVVVGPGSMTALSVVDGAPFGSLGTDGRELCKTGSVLDNTVIALGAPAAGRQIWLIEASLTEVDGGPVALPYYNSAAPSVAWSGPGNSGAAQNTRRTLPVLVRGRAGVSATDGSQVPPGGAAGWVPLYWVGVAAGQVAIGLGDISPVPGAPFLRFHLPQLTPGFSRQAVFTSSTVWPVPAGVQLARVRLVGAGGGGGGGDASGGTGFSGGGGGAGGYAEAIVSVVPGYPIPVTVGLGGAGSGPLTTGAAGGISGFGPAGAGSEVRALGGMGGGSNNPDSHGGQSGVGVSGSLSLAGGLGSDGARIINVPGGSGGASAFGGGGRGSFLGGAPAVGQAPGSGGGGAYGPSSAGGAGAPGLVLVEY